MLLAGAIASGCGSSSGTAASNPSSTGSSGTATANGGVLRYGVDLADSFSGTFDTGASTDDCSYTEYTSLDDTLLQPGNTSVSPELVETYSTTPSTVTLNLRPDAKFSDGTPITASDVAASLEHNKVSPFRFSLHYISSIDVTSATSLTITLTQPVAGDLLWALTYIDGMVLDPAALPDSSTQPVSSGPFTLQSFTPGSLLDLTADPTFWDASAYRLKGVQFVQVNPGPQEISALETGTVDMLSVDPEEFDRILAEQ